MNPHNPEAVHNFKSRVPFINNSLWSRLRASHFQWLDVPPGPIFNDLSSEIRYGRHQFSVVQGWLLESHSNMVKTSASIYPGETGIYEN
jgi:hypothetical protein